jgi:MFS family permease
MAAQNGTTGGMRPAGVPRTATGAAIERGARLTAPGLAVLLAGYAVSIADVFVVNAALASIGEDLRASVGGLELVVSVYGAAYAVALVLFGRLGDAHGRRRMYAWGMVAFTLTSALCGIAPSLEALVLARAVQGFAAAMTVPQVLATIHAATSGATRARAVGAYGATAGLAAVLGQIAGGALLTMDVAGLGWRAVFLVNIPVGIAAVALVRRVPETRAPERLGIDRAGTLLLALAVLSLLMTLHAAALGRPVSSALLLLGGGACAWLFWRRERRLEAAGGSPLLPPTVLSRPGLRSGLAAMALFSAAFGGFLFAFALVTQAHLGLDPLTTGLVLAPFASMFFLVSLATPRMAALLGRRIVTLGAAVQGVGLLALAALLGGTWPRPDLAAALGLLALIGAGQALIGPALFRIVLAEVPAELAGAGSGALVTTQQAATALGASAGGGLLTALTAAHGASHASQGVLAALAVFSLAVMIVSTRLPDPR